MIKDSGSNYSFGQKSPVANVPKSGFDLSYINSFPAWEMMLCPSWYEYTVPGDKFNKKEQHLLRVVNSPVVPLASRQRIFSHTYYSSLSKLWKYANTFFAHNQSSALQSDWENKVVPKVYVCYGWTEYVNDLFGDTPIFKNLVAGSPNISKLIDSYLDCLGFDFLRSNGGPQHTVSEAVTQIPAFKFMLCMRIKRDYYTNNRIARAQLEYNIANNSAKYGLQFEKDLLDFIFPEDDGDFRIGSAQWNKLFVPVDEDDILRCVANFYKCISLCLFREWSDDYFTTAQLSPITGEEPVYDDNLEVVARKLNLDENHPNVYGFDEENLGINYFNTNGGEKYYNNMNGVYTSDTHLTNLDDKALFGLYTESSDIPRPSGSTGDTVFRTSNSVLDNIARGFNSSFAIRNHLTMDALRNLACANAIMEKLAKCKNGSYGEFARAFFGVTPKSAVDYRADYIGGNYAPIVFSEVVNTANNQGKITGRGFSANSGDVGSFFADDYGIAISFVSVVPDTYYKYGIKKQDLMETSDDFYLPERASLGMEPIFACELRKGYAYDLNEKGKIFGWQNRFDCYRYRYNESHLGIFENGIAPYIETRDVGSSRFSGFNNSTDLNYYFLDGRDALDNKWRSVMNPSVSPDFFIQILNDVKAVRPIPYKAQENNLGF